MELQTTLEERENYAKFERLAASDLVQQERRNCISDHPQPGYAKAGSELQLNNVGIKAINWTDDCRVSNLLTDAGEWLYPEMAPRLWESCLIILLPVVGFFIPWGIVRVIGWVLAGFAA